MALLKIENAKVIRTVGTRGAFAVEEYVTLPDGRTFPKTFTVWNEKEPAPPVGSLVSVVGVLSAKTREYPAPSGMKTAIDMSINEPEFQILHAVKVEDDNKEETPF